VAYDGSGSTGNQAKYHDETQRIVRALQNVTQRMKILFWDTTHRTITERELAQINKERKGGGGTESACIAEHVRATAFHGDLVIITDGQVSTQSVDRCATLLGADWAFTSVTAHLIDTGGPVNMSVTCPFTRCSPHTIYTYMRAANYERTAATSVTAEDLQILERIAAIQTVADFMTVAPTMERAIVARTMGSTGDPGLRDAILAMKKRMMATSGSGSSSVVTLEAALDADNADVAHDTATALTHEYYAELDGDDVESGSWSARINRMVSMCEGALRSTFDLSNLTGAIKGDRARRAGVATATEATAISETEQTSHSTSTSFQCPITCDDEHDVVLLVAGDYPPLLANLDKDTVNDVTDCPLNLFRYPTLVAALKDRLDHPISLRALKAAEGAGMPIVQSPITRRNVTGAICLGPAADHRAATTWTLARTVAGGKLLGNPDLWFACVWLLVERGEVPYLRPILPQLRAHMTWRLGSQKTSISLTGLAEYPTVRVRLGTAVWYVFASAAWTSEPRRDLVRAHLPHIEPLRELLFLAGYSVDPLMTAYITRTRVLLSMLAWVKRDRHCLPNLMRALHQRGVKITTGEGTMFVPIDGTPTNEQVIDVLGQLPAVYRGLTPAELVGLAALVDPSKSAADVPLPYVWNPPVLPVSTTVWPYKVKHLVIPICPATCRPYYRVREATWREAATAFFGIPTKQMLSANEQFGNYVVRRGSYPTRDEFIRYLYDRKGQLPDGVVVAVEAMLSEEYRAIMDTVPAATFAERFLASCDIQRRIEIEHHI
jgi:hypothetical protein